MKPEIVQIIAKMIADYVTGEAFQIDGEGAVRIVPFEILATLIAFALSPVTWRALRAAGTGR